ncbi:MAG: T9SS type A sorting domain-containing protein [Saprospiraceae bacterium]
MRQILTLCLFWSITTTLISQNTIRQDDPPQSYPPIVSKGELLGDIPSLRDLKPQTKVPDHIPRKLAQKRNYFFANKMNNPDPLPRDGDPLAKKSVDNRESGQEIIPGFNFEGLRDPGGISPPDPTGDIGKNHYLQMTNASGGAWMQVWDKHTGQSVYGPALSNTIWNTVGTGSIGDPIVQYDHDAERWLIMELQGFFTTELLIAISNTSDPTGGWKAYRFQTLGFGDYPKLYVWNNAYFITVNEISNGNKCSGYALERDAILAGEPTFDLYRFEMPNYQAIQYQPATGADWEGGPPPPAGSPAYIFRVYDDAWDGGQDHLQIWEVDVDWNNPAQSSITGPDKVYPTPFEVRVCHGSLALSFDCIEQPDVSAPRITALENIIMYRAPYRNFGTYESVVFNHVSDVSGQVGDGGDAAVRWYELRKQGGGDWQIYQEGTYAPDLATNRFMGTICTDEAGNIALGYTGVSQSLYPGLYLTGRRHTDPPGDMTVEEYTLVPGGASHFGDNRWGDYSNMSVDPEDGRTFWFTGEYQPVGASWGTRIGSFKIQLDTYDIKPISLLSPVPSALLGNGETVKVKIFNGGLVPVSGFSTSLYFEGNLLATENVAGTIQPGESVDHTFAATVDMPVVGIDYNFRIITNWLQDQFVRNDTLDAVVQKLTSNDVAAVGKYNLPGLVCGSETDFGIIIRNASGLPLTSAKVHWRINTQPFNIYNWTGNLAAGERDTIDLHATNILNGLNGLKIFTSLPNGVPDERTANDSLAPIKFNGNLDGTYLIAEAETVSGVLAWELRSQTNLLLASGEMSAGQKFTQICSDDNTCYRFILKSSTFSWNGHFRLYDIYGNVLVEAFGATKDEPQEFNICTPQRKQVDVGALDLASPVSGPNLSAAEPIKIRFRNFGLSNQSNIEVAYRLNGGAWKTEVYPVVVASGATIEHTFSTTEDLSTQGGIYNFELSTTIPGDEQPDNDTVSVTVRKRAIRELEITDVHTIQACTDSSFAFIGVTIRNNGLGDEQHFDVQIDANGVPQPTVEYFEFIAPDASVEINLFVQGVQFGQNNVAVDLTNVNGQGEDEQPDNDTGSVTFDLHPDGFGVQMFFATNGSPAENRWELRDDQGNLVRSGGPYPTAFGLFGEELCLEKDKCYVFHLFDSGGDGMEGGFVDLFSPNGGSFWTYAGGNFGSEITAPFCATTACADFFVDVALVNPSSAGASDGQIAAMPSGGQLPYQYNLNGGAFQSDSVFTNLPVGFYTLGALDATGCLVEKFIELGTVGINEPAQLRSLKVSPNPTSGIANIELPAIEGEQSKILEVFDLKGKLIQTARLVRWDNTLRGMVILDNQPAGTYFLRVKGLARPLTARLVKK